MSQRCAPPLHRQLASCAYRQYLFITKSATAYVVLFIVPILLIGFMAVVQQFIFINSFDAQLAHKAEGDFERQIDTKLPTCASTPYDYLSKPCIDLSYYIDSKFSDQETTLLNLVIEDVILTHQLTEVRRFTNFTDFKAYTGGVKRQNESILVLSFEKQGVNQPIQAVIHYSMMRYGAKLNPQMNFRVIDKQTNYFLPFSRALFQSFHKVANSIEAEIGLQVNAWPHKKYEGYRPISYFTGMITTLSATSLLLLLISMLMDDLSHPCAALYAFLSVSIPARIISWVFIGLLMCCAQALVMYAVGVLFDLPSYTDASFRDGITPYLVFAISLIPLALLITLCATPNIRCPSLATTQPIVTATYTVGLMSILTLVVLAPLSSTALKLADVHSSMSELEGQGVPLSVKFVGYTLRLFNLAIGVALCSLGVSSTASITSVKYSEIGWLWIDMAWMVALSMIVLIIKMRGQIKRRASQLDSEVAVEIQHLNKSFFKGKIQALKNVDLTVRNEDKLFILGNAGAGKSTLLHCINGVEPRFEGSVECSKRIGFVSQHNTLWGCLTVENHVSLVSLISGQKSDSLKGVLEEVGLEQFPNRLARDLSFGMKRRLCLAMALAADPEILILDEASSGVDPVSKQLIHTVIQKQSCCIATTHDLQEAQLLATSLCFMNKAEVVKIGTVPDLFAEFSVSYQAQLYGSADATASQISEAIGKPVSDQGCGIFQCAVYNIDEFCDLSAKCKNAACISDCRLLAPSIEGLFQRLCRE